MKCILLILAISSSVFADSKTYKSQIIEKNSETHEEDLIKMDVYSEPESKFIYSDTEYDEGKESIQYGLSGKLKINGLTKILNLDDTEKKDLRVNKNSNGYYLEKAYKWKVGLGVKVSKYFSNLDVGAQAFKWSLGLMPIKGKHVHFTRFVDTLEEAKEAENRKVPESAKELESWKEGELLSYTSSGGLVFKASVQYSFAKIGTTISASTENTIEIRKLADNKVLVSLLKAKVKEAAAYTGLSVLTLSASHMNEKGLGFSYIFDLDSAGGVDAFEGMIHGNIVDAQDVGENLQDPRVQTFEDYKFAAKSNSKGVYFGVFFLNFMSSKTKFSQETTVKNYASAQKAITDTGIYTEMSSSKFFKNERLFTRSFVGEVSRVLEASGNLLKIGRGAKINWHYEKENGKKKDLKKQLTKLYLNTLVGEYYNFILPEEDELNYFQIDYSLIVSENLLINYFAKPSFASQKLEQRANELLNLESKKPHFKSAFCTKRVRKYGHKKSSNFQPESFSQCYSRFQKSIKKYGKELKKLSPKIVADYNAKNYKKFSERLTEIGKVIWSTPFIYKAFHEKNVACGGTSEFEISGELIPRFRDYKVFKLNKSKCFN